MEVLLYVSNISKESRELLKLHFLFMTWFLICGGMQIHKQPCHVVYTDYRPTPLQHYIFPSGGDGLYLVVDEKGKFREDSFQKALNALVPVSEGDKKKENGKWQKGLVMGRTGEESDIFKMVKMIIQRQYDPVILFSFSKRECETLAMQVGVSLW